MTKWGGNNDSDQLTLWVLCAHSQVTQLRLFLHHDQVRWKQWQWSDDPGGLVCAPPGNSAQTFSALWPSKVETMKVISWPCGSCVRTPSKLGSDSFCIMTKWGGNNYSDQLTLWDSDSERYSISDRTVNTGALLIAKIHGYLLGLKSIKTLIVGLQKI